jgi:arylsulfatase A-like enzyme
VPAHYGVRTATHKLICYYNDPLGQPGANEPADPVEWELFDLGADPLETTNLIDDPSYVGVVAELRVELARLQGELGDVPFEPATGGMS